MHIERDFYEANLKQVYEHEGFAKCGELLPLKAVARFLGCEAGKLYTADTDLPIKKFGGRYFVTRMALARWLCK